MVSGPRKSATCNGSRSSCPRVACTFTASKAVFPAYIQSAVTRCEHCVSYVAITLKTPTYSFPSAAGPSVLSVSTASFSASAKPPRCHSRFTRTCFAMPVGSSSQMMATTRGPCSTTSGTRTSSTRSGTPNWRPTASRTFGGTNSRRDRAVYIVRSGARWRWHPARLALPRADRRVRFKHQPVLGLGRLDRGRRRGGCRFYRPLDHSNRAASLRFERCLQVLDHILKLLVRQVLDHIALLDLVLARDQ